MTEQKKLIENIVELINETRCDHVRTTYDREFERGIKEAIIEAIERKYKDGK